MQHITLKVIPGTHTLELPNRGNTHVHLNGDRKLRWEIHNPNDIHSFRIRGKAGGNPFEEPISTDYGTVLNRTVYKPQPSNDWFYSIDWKDHDGNLQVCDPKISIKPSIVSLPVFIVTLACAILSFIVVETLLEHNKND
jgi:hypothetical protein